MTKFHKEFTNLFDQINKMTVGFEPILKDFESNIRLATNTYPPHNVIVISEEQYVLEFAVAGFKKTDISIELHNGTLTVSGKKEKIPEDDVKYHFKGISDRSFEKTFKLADHVEVINAGLEDGILSISLVRDVPEAKKAKLITIN